MPKFWIPIALAAAVLPAPGYGQQDEQRAMPLRRGGERMLQMQRQEQPAAQSMRTPEAAPPHMHRHGRMSPEERRQLRRDIDAAGRELYPPPSQRRY